MTSAGFLELSYPMGVFSAGHHRFEYHLGLLVYREGKRLHIWESEFTRQLGQELMKTNANWKQMLER